jgi:hypothetical protein
MGSLTGELARREAAARAEADRLRARIEELSGELARAEEQVTRLAIAREEVARVLEEPSALPGGAAAGEPRPAVPVRASAVPQWRDGADASVLPREYRDLLEVAEDAGRALRAGEFAAGAGLPADKAGVERLRARLKVLAARGWLKRVVPCQNPVHDLTWCFTLGARAHSPHLPVHGPGDRLAGAAGAQ